MCVYASVYKTSFTRMTKSFVPRLPCTMESSLLFSTPLAMLVTTLIIIGVLKVIAVAYHQCTYWQKRGVPHMSGKSGFVAFCKIIFGRTSFIDHTNFIYNSDSESKYVGLMDLVGTPVVLVRDPDLIRDVMVKEFEHFPDHNSFVDEEIDPLFSKNVFFLRGNRWKEMRNTLSPSFTASKMKLMFELVSKCSREFAEYLADHPELCSSLDTKEAFRRYATDVIATSAFGISVNSMKDRDNEFFKRGMEAVSTFTSSMFWFLFFRIFPRLAKALNMNLFRRTTSQFFNSLVADTIKTREEQNIVRPDMINLLMQARKKEGSSVHEMTLEDITAQAFIFFLAGFNTTAMHMCFVAHELAVHPNIQERLSEEVEKHFAEGNGQLSYEALSKMVYMDMVLSEGLRKYPPLLFIDRLCAKNYVFPPPKPGLKSVTIEAKSVTWAPVYAMHHDPKYFPNPSKFDPERFSEENKDNIVPYTYMPFGLGPRKCIGNRFAFMETKLLLAHLLHKFVFKATEKTVDPIVFQKNQFDLQPEGGFWIALEKREK